MTRASSGTLPPFARDVVTDLHEHVCGVDNRSCRLVLGPKIDDFYKFSTLIFGPVLTVSLSLSLSHSLTYLSYASIHKVGGIRTRHKHPWWDTNQAPTSSLSLPMAATYSLSPIYKVRRCLSATNPVRLRIPSNAEITGKHSQKCAL